MTPTQARVLMYVKSRKTPPTYREIGRACRITSTASVAWHLARLRDLGLVRWEYATRRSVKAT